MSLTADFDLKERVRAAVDIVDIVGQQLELRRQGRSFAALCPWHDDRRPSMMVNPERQTWRCWVCDIGGDVFSYVMKRDGVGFPEALRILGERAGIAIESSPRAVGAAEDKAALMAALRWAVDQFYACLETSPEAESARQYAAQRGIDDSSRRSFRIGYAPAGWDWLINRGKHAGFAPEILHSAGLAVPRNSGGGHYDMFRDRLIFPIFDLQGRPISAGGRQLPGGDAHGGKYINGPETKLFSKSRQLYGLNWARDAIVRQDRVMVMEGYTDVIAARQAGIEPVVAVLGTALGEAHVRILKRFTDTVVLVLDGDAAGQKRADEVLELFIGAEVDLRVLTLPDGQDPADYISRHGASGFEGLVEAAPDAIDHKLQRLIAGVDLTHDTHRATKAVEGMLKVLSRTPGGSSNLRLQQTLVRLARTFAVPVEQLERRLSDLRSTRLRFDRPVASVADDPGVYDSGTGVAERRTPSPRPASDAIVGLDRELFEIFIERPEFVGMAVEVIDENWLSSDSARELMKYYQLLELQGLSVDVRDCILTIENESLKNQLVAMDERVQDKADSAVQSAEVRFQSILNRYRETEHRAETERQLVQLGQGTIPDDQVAEVLREMIAAQRVRQGISSIHTRRVEN